MLCVGSVHGDRRAFNVLINAAGPVIIDPPQVANAAGGNNGLAMRECGIRNITETSGRFGPDLLASKFAMEMWSLFKQGEIKLGRKLVGVSIEDEIIANVDDVTQAIEGAREEAIRRQLGRDVAQAAGRN